MKQIFQVLVVGALTLQVACFLLPFATDHLYSGDALTLLGWNALGAHVDMRGPIPYAILLSYMVVSLGLIYLKTWARTGLIGLTIFGIVSTPLWGMAVVPPLYNSLATMMTLADGAILAIAYLTSLGTQFD